MSADNVQAELLALKRDVGKLQRREGNAGFYYFVVTAPLVPPVPGNTYTNNGRTFTVIVQSTTVFFAWGDGPPEASGDLTRTSGAGSTPIAFSAVKT